MLDVDKGSLVEAVAICALSWAAIPVVYVILVRLKKMKKKELTEKEKKKENG